MIRINLLPLKAAQKQERLRGQLLVTALAVLVALIGCGFLYISQTTRIHQEKAAISKIQDEMMHLRKKIGAVGHYKKMQKDLQGKLAVLDKLKVGKKGPVHLLDELSKALPDKVWLTSFKESGDSLAMSGRGINEKTVAQFMRQLEASPYFRGVELQVIEQTSQGALTVEKFNITCRATTPPKSPQTE